MDKKIFICGYVLPFDLILYIKCCCENFPSTFEWTLFHLRGPGCSVGIATDYGLDGSGPNPGGGEIFRPLRLTLGPTQSPIK